MNTSRGKLVCLLCSTLTGCSFFSTIEPLPAAPDTTDMDARQDLFVAADMTPDQDDLPAPIDMPSSSDMTATDDMLADLRTDAEMEGDQGVEMGMDMPDLCAPMACPARSCGPSDDGCGAMRTCTCSSGFCGGGGEFGRCGSPPLPVTDSDNIGCINQRTVLATCPTTGQALYGQDANYSFPTIDLANSQGALKDAATGYYWATRDESANNLMVATQSCANANYAGWRDWRLPSLRELVTALDLGLEDPAFPSILSMRAPALYLTGDGWVVDAANGEFFPTPNFSSGFLLRCLRAGPSQLPSPRFATQASSVLDAHTGLQWERRPPQQLTNWEDALTRCENLSLDGHDDWRLPAYKALATLVDTGQVPTIDPGAFPDTLRQRYWSSTGDWPDGPGEAYTIDFEDASGNDLNIVQNSFASRCVRGGD